MSVGTSQFEFGLFEYAIIELKKKFDQYNNKCYEESGHKPIETIKHRIKSTESIKNKLAANGYPDTYESIIKNLNDVAGMRIICSFIEDIFHFSEFIKEIEGLEIIKIKDYISQPKKSGYRSLHMHIRVPVSFFKHTEFLIVELQIRTIAMDFWASLEHKLNYKNSFSNDSDFIQEELVAYAGLLHEVDSRMQHLKAIAIGKNHKNTIKGGDDNDKNFSGRR